MSPVDYASIFGGFNLSVTDSDGTPISEAEENKENIKERDLCEIPDYSDFTLSELSILSESVRSECLCIMDILTCDPSNSELRRLLSNSFENLKQIYAEYNKKYEDEVESKRIIRSALEAEEEITEIIYNAFTAGKDISVEDTVRICELKESLESDYVSKGKKILAGITEITSVFNDTEYDGFAKERFFKNEGLRQIKSIENSYDIPDLLIKIPLSGSANYRYFKTKKAEEIWSLSEMSLPDRYKEIKITEINKEKYMDVIDIISKRDKDGMKTVYPDISYSEINRMIEEYFTIQDKLVSTRKDDGVQPETKYGIYGRVKQTEEFVGGAIEYCLALSNGTLKELGIVKRGVPVSTDQSGL